MATTLMGLVVVLVGGVFGAMHPAVRYLFAVIPIAMGLHLLGIINIRVPGVRHWRPIRTGPLGAFLTGLLFSLAILPCATPVLASILSYAASHHHVLVGSGLLFTYGAGIGVPLVLIGAGAGFLSSLRPSARWWSVVHRISGVILIGLGFYLLWQA
jgi:cytochrome c biogenesis protein CcdA